ncbi:MAG: response regulator, partial [Haliea sp.]
ALHPDDHGMMQSAWQQARGQNAEWQVEHRLKRRDGAWHWFLTRVAPQVDATGSVLRWFGTTTNIETARAAAETLRNADRQKDEFLATLAHELRNPLAPIRTAVQLLASPASSDSTRSRATSVIERQVSHMAHLLDDLIDIARITQRRLELKKSRVALDAVVQVAVEAARPGADAKRHRLEVRLPAEKILLTVDQVRVAQVLSNLLNNAAKYTDPGGDIRLDVRADGEWLEFTVTDNGIGLGPGAADKVFAMFAQEQTALHRSEGGLGIGLALSRGLVELHGGTISAASAGLGQGSSFTVRLPCDPSATPAAPSVDNPHQTVAGATRTVLLADDNRDAVETLAEFIQLDGHAVHIAYDGVQAVEHALRLKPDVLVLDIGMPGMTGYEVAQRIRAQPDGDRPLLIAATGWGQEDDRQRALVAGFDMHLTKPFDPQQLLAVIAEYPQR